MHTHGTDGLRELNDDRAAMLIHLETHHGPWPEGLSWSSLDYGVLRQIHGSSRHGESLADRTGRARLMLRNLRYPPSGRLPAGLTHGQVEEVDGGAEYALFDDVTGAEFRLSIRVAPWQRS